MPESARRGSITVLLALLVAAASLLPGCFGTTSEPEEVVNEVEQEAKQLAREANLQAIDAAVQTYYLEKGEYPSSLDDLYPGYLPRKPTDPMGGTYYLQKEGGKTRAAVR